MNALPNVEISPLKRSTEWCEPAALTLDECGMICDCNTACGELFGYNRRELMWQHVSKLLPQLSNIKLVQDGQINPRLNFISHCGHLFYAQKRNGGIFSSVLSFVYLEGEGRHILRLLVRLSGNTGS